MAAEGEVMAMLSGGGMRRQGVQRQMTESAGESDHGDGRRRREGKRGQRDSGGNLTDLRHAQGGRQEPEQREGGSQHATWAFTLRVRKKGRKKGVWRVLEGEVGKQRHPDTVSRPAESKQAVPAPLLPPRRPSGE